jgi:hypothetical protein
MPAQNLEIRIASAKQRGELQRAAEREGMSTEKYLKQVVVNHLDRIRRIEKSSFFELNAPLREALGGKSEEELDALVDAARARPRQVRSKPQENLPAARSRSKN